MAEYGDALAHAPLVTHRLNLAKVRPCLRSLPVRVRVQCVLTWVHIYFGNYSSSAFVDTYESRQWTPISPGLVAKVDRAFGHAYKDHLLQSLPRNLATAKRDYIREVEDMSSVLILLAQIVNTGHPDTRSTVLDVLMQSCELQTRLNTGRNRAVEPYTYAHVPVVCLFVCLEKAQNVRSATNDSSKRPCSVNVSHTHNFSVSQRLVDIAHDYIRPDFPLVSGMKDGIKVAVVLSSVAIFLLALGNARNATRPLSPTATMHMQEILPSFATFLMTNRLLIRSMAELAQDKSQPTIATPRAVEAIAKCLVQLTESGYVPWRYYESVAAQLSLLCNGVGALRGAQRWFTQVSPQMAERMHMVRLVFWYYSIILT